MARAPMANALNVGSTGGALAPSGGNFLSTVSRYTAQPSVKRALPMMVAVLSGVIGLIFFALLQQPNRTTLYASLPEAEKAQIVDALTNNGVDVALDPTTGDVLVPVADLHSSRMKLAALGLPSTAADGYDSLSNIPMGTSRSVEMMRLKQSQEVELARSIMEIRAIKSARVHLAIPERTVFVRDQATPSASVFLQLAGGRSLDESQVEAIINLVSASISGMSKEDVTVVDQQGRMLSKAIDDPASITTDNQFQYRMRLENIYRSRIESLVSPLVGAGNVNAQVNIEIDFTRSESTEERVDPNGNALRSEQTSRDSSSQAPARGIPGTTANTPPNEAQLAETATVDPNGLGAEANTTTSGTMSELKNYEVSRTVATTQNPSNRILRIDAAVLLRENTIIDPTTGLEVPEVMAPELMKEIEQLVSSALGMNKERGDTLAVTSRPFVNRVEGVVENWHEQPWVANIAKQGAMILLLAVITLGVVKPLLNRVLVPSGNEMVARGGLSEDEAVALESIEVGEGETLEDIKAKLKPKKSNISMEMLDTANTYDDKVALIRMIVGDEAGRVSNVFKEMIKKDMQLIG
ncbi:MAG: flagellar M-ring protein FliF [Paracoccaceae bacterium]|nr:flagellar M-ring protein FliF [Paracoccaceae bacterium]MDO7660665.1 flagellar M-ring protein FliF [Paracoccaceae bacterium]